MKSYQLRSVAVICLLNFLGFSAQGALSCASLLADTAQPHRYMITYYEGKSWDPFERYSAEEEALKKRLQWQAVLDRRESVAAHLSRRAGFNKLDDGLLSAPYEMTDIESRVIPVYADAVSTDSARFNPTDFKFSEDLNNSTQLRSARGGHTWPAQVMIHVEDAIDMNMLHTGRFTDKLPSPLQAETVKSKASARDAFVDNRLRSPVEFSLVEIKKISSRKIVVTKNPAVSDVSGPKRTFNTAFENVLQDGALELSEVGGVPMILGSAIRASRPGKVEWSLDLYEYSRNWKVLNPDIPFMVGFDNKQTLRMVYPMFRLHSPHDYGLITVEDLLQIDEALQRVDKNFGAENGYRVGAGKVSSALGRLLSYRYALGDFGPLGFRFLKLKNEVLGILRSANIKNLNQDGHVFKYINMIRAQILTQTTNQVLGEHLKQLVNKARFEDWFETVYWLSHSEISPIQKSVKGRADLSLGYDVASGPAAALSATGWITPKSLRRHFKKHGEEEMGFETVEDYLSSAVDFLMMILLLRL